MSPSRLDVGRCFSGVGRVPENLLVQCAVIIPRIHVASNERGVDGESFDEVFMGFEEGSEAARLVQVQELVSESEIDENRVAATILPGRDDDAGALLPLADEG